MFSLDDYDRIELFMKHPKIILILGIWFVFVTIMGIPSSIKKVLIIIPALFLITLAITAIRNNNLIRKKAVSQHNEFIQDIVEDIVNETEEIIDQKTEKLRDIL